jgi:hypothetical protein
LEEANIINKCVKGHTHKLAEKDDDPYDLESVQYAALCLLKGFSHVLTTYAITSIDKNDYKLVDKQNLYHLRTIGHGKIVKEIRREFADEYGDQTFTEQGYLFELPSETPCVC